CRLILLVFLPIPQLMGLRQEKEYERARRRTSTVSIRRWRPANFGKKMQLSKTRPPSHSSSPWFLLQGSSCLCNACYRGLTLSLRMNYQLIPKELRPIAEKIEARERLSEEEALTLYRAIDLI